MPTPKKSKAKLKKELDALFSKYIRNFYAVNGEVQCYTCGQWKPVKSMQNGHFLSRSHLSIRFDPRNCRPQCFQCNVYNYGRTGEFGGKLEEETPGVVQDLIKKSRELTIDYPYEQEIAKYKAILKKNGWL